MKEFKIKNGPFIKANNSTRKMMYNLIACLVTIMLFSLYKNAILPLIKGYGNIVDLFKLVILIITPAFVCLITEYIYYLLKREKKKFTYLMKNSFAIIPGLFISMIIPINTPFWLIVVISFIASFSKMIFGGLGKNILNPALSGAIIVILLASGYVSSLGGYLNSYEIENLALGTPLYNLNQLFYVGTYEEIVGGYGTLLTLFFGNVPGAIGTTSIFLCVFSFIYLTLNKVIKWRIPVFAIITMFLMTTIIGLANGMGLWYPLFNILAGPTLFALIFMATDPVTSPIDEHSQVIGGILLGVIVILIRFSTNLIEGELIAILIFNLLTLLLNKFYIDYGLNKLYKSISVGIVILICVISSLIITNNIDKEEDLKLGNVNIKNNV